MRAMGFIFMIGGMINGTLHLLLGGLGFSIYGTGLLLLSVYCFEEEKKRNKKREEAERQRIEQEQRQQEKKKRIGFYIDEEY